LPVFIPISIFAATLAAFLRKIYDFDIWYHLAIGREVLASWIPDKEIFVYTLAGEEGAYHEWGFGALFALAYKAAGFWGMSILHGLVCAAILTLLYFAGSIRKGARAPGIIFLAGIVYLAEYRFVYRPEMALFLFLAAELFFLEKWLEEGDKKFLYSIPPLTFLISQFHPSAIILLIVSGFYIAQYALNEKFSLKALRLPVAVSLVSALASLLNPYGLAQLILPFGFASQGYYLSTNLEFRPVLESIYRNWYLALLALGVVSLPFQEKGRRAARGLQFLFFAYMSLKYMRNFALFSMALYIPLTNAASGLLNKLRIEKAGKGIVLYGLSFIVLALSAVHAASDGKWGAGPIKDLFPERAAAFIKEKRPGGRVFSSMANGDYLEWSLYPQYQVFVDGRHYEYDRSLYLYHRILRADWGWEKDLYDYDVRTITISAAEIVKGKLHPLLAALDSSPRWRPVLVEPFCITFLREDELLRTGTIPLRKDVIWKEALAESQLMLGTFPGSQPAHLAMSIAYFRLGDLRSAEQAMETYLSLSPGDGRASYILYLLKNANRGNPDALKELDYIYRTRHGFLN